MIKCVICMKDFEPVKKTMYCCSKQCSHERHVILARWKYKYDKLFDIPKPVKPAKKKKVKGLAAVNAKARAAGMTYGEYMARTEGGMK